VEIRYYVKCGNNVWANLDVEALKHDLRISDED
jgi:hypothetical protein